MKFAIILFALVLNFSCSYCQEAPAKPPTAKELAVEKSRAAKGHADAQYHLGQYYFYGSGVAKNYPVALKWLNKAAAKNDVDALLLLSEMYYEGTGVKKDIKTAIGWLKKAAENGSLAAASDLGEIYETGDGVPEDMTEAVKWYRIAADKGEALAMIALGFAYTDGDGVPADKAAGYEWFVKAAAKGSASSMRYLGDYFAQDDLGNDCVKALDWYMKAADAGDSFSLKPVGVMIMKDECATADKAMVAAWMKKHALNNEPEACFYMGGFYVIGAGVKKSAAMGMEMLIKDRELGGYSGDQRNLSTNNLFTLYNSGDLAAEDKKRLLDWFKTTAVKKNDEEMMAVVANIYINKESATGNDYRAGLDWAMKSADRGNPGGCFWVGFIYSKGLGDIKQNDVKAFQWIEKAAKKGDRDAMKMLSTFYEFGTGTIRNAVKAQEWKTKSEEEDN